MKWIYRKTLFAIWSRTTALQIVFILTLLLTFSFILLRPTSAAWVGKGFGSSNDDCDNTDVMNEECFVRDTFSDQLMSIDCGILPIPGEDGCSNDPIKYQGMLRGSLVGTLNNFIVTAFAQPPADLALWLDDTSRTLGFKSGQVHAQGIGFTGFALLLPLWKAFRNISYVLLAAVMLVIGFMVMLRKKIDPRTVVTVQNAIPRIVIALLLITFSYAIVGILIDFMYLVILLAVNLFNSTELLPQPGRLLSAMGYNTPEALYVQGGLFENFLNVEVNPYKLLGLNWDAGTANTISLFVAAPLLAVIGGFIGGAITGGPFAPFGALIGGIIGVSGPIIYTLISLAIAFLFIRLFIFFLGAYIQIVIALLFGPIQILFEAFPGSSAFSSWFKNLISNLVVFPAGAVMFMLSAVFAKFSSEGGNIWAPPYAPALSSVTAISTAVSLGLLFAIPNIAGSIRESLKAKPFVEAGPEGVVGSLAHPAGLMLQAYQLWQSRQTTQLLRKNVLRQQPEAPEGG